MGNIINAISETPEHDQFPLTIRQKNKYGWIPDFPDQRDKLVKWTAFKHKLLKNSIELNKSEFMPNIYDQYTLGSCTANAIAAAYEFDQRKQSLTDFTPSRMFIYYNERKIENTINSDSGASIRDGIKVVNRVGVCTEEECPYEISKFTLGPSRHAYMNAKNHKSIEYRSINIDIEDVKKALNSGFPVIFGFSVYESFEYEETAESGIMPIPEENEKIIGGHAALIVGYHSDEELLIVRNSWGTNWGKDGYFYMPYEFFTEDNCADAWIINSVSSGHELSLL
jgi:C1A family cysteine protease